MEVCETTIEYSGSPTYRIYPIGDTHFGTKHCVEDWIGQRINQIKQDSNALWIGLGDYAEFISTSDPRWDCQGIADWVEKDNIAVSETNHVVKMFQPIKGKCLGLLEGNHEDSIRLHSDVYVQKNICDGLGVKNLGYSCWLKLRFKRKGSSESHVIKCVVAHGAGGAITPGAKLTRLQRFMNAYDAQIFMHGHTHDIITHCYPVLALNANNEITHTQKVGAMTGCWFSTYTQGIKASYGEKKSYPPTSLGCPVFTIALDQKHPPMIAVAGQ